MCFHWLKAGKNSVWCSGGIKMSIFPHGYILEGMYRCYFVLWQCSRTKYVRCFNLFSSLSTSIFRIWKKSVLYIYLYIVADKDLVFSDYLHWWQDNSSLFQLGVICVRLNILRCQTELAEKKCLHFSNILSVFSTSSPGLGECRSVLNESETFQFKCLLYWAHTGCQ